MRNLLPEEAIDVMRQLKVCYSIITTDGSGRTTVVHMFPSLRSAGGMVLRMNANVTLTEPTFNIPQHNQVHLVRYYGRKYTLSSKGVVQQAALCRLLVSCCEVLKVK